MGNYQHKKKLIYIVLAVLFIVGMGYPQLVSAEENSTLGFTVDAIRPDTQIETNKTYFFIETQPDVSQVLKVRVKSTKKEPVKVKAFVVNASTGTGGNIEYFEQQKGEKIDETLKNPLTEITKFPVSEITVQNYEEKFIDLVVTPPKESYEGIKLGAVVFELVQDQPDKKGVSSKYQYRIGLITSESNDDYEDAKDLKLVSAKLGLKLGQKRVTGVIHNPEPKIADNLKIEAVVTKKGSKTVIKKQTFENARMAPNSTFDLGVDWGVDQVEAGDYTLNVHAQNDKQEWNWKQNFSVTGEQAKEVNKKSPFKVVLPEWVPYVIVAAIALLIIITVTLVARSNKWKKMVKERARKRQKNKQNKRKSANRKNHY